MTLRHAFALSALGALAGCGLLSSDETLSAYPSQGIGDFGSSGPVEVCIGSARVVAPAAATGASGVCVTTGAAGKACSSDSACEGIETCSCGRCIVLACLGAGSCGEGRVCRDKRCTTSCSSDSECASGEKCNAGGCAKACSSDAACHHGEQCDSLDRVCVTKLCSDAVPCGAGSTCEAVELSGELHEPELLDGAALVELRPAAEGSLGRVYRARVDSAGHWTADPEEPVLTDASVSLGAPSVLAGKDGLDLWFAIGDGKGIGHAVSKDQGRSFTRDAGVALEPKEAWENGWIGSPAVVTFQDTTYLFYEGGPGAGIGVARVEGSKATRIGSAPVLVPKDVEHGDDWREVSKIGAPYAVVAGDILRVYFTARGIEGSDAKVGDAGAPAEVNDSIGMAASRDAKAFSVFASGPVFSRLANLRTYLGEREAAVRVTSTGAEIVFVAGDAAGTESGLGHAGP